MNAIKITFKHGNDTHHYVLSRNGTIYKGDIRYISKQTSVFRRTFKLNGKESEQLRHEIISDYTQWNGKNRVHSHTATATQEGNQTTGFPPPSHGMR